VKCRAITSLLTFLVVLTVPALAAAHKPSDSYLTLDARGSEVFGQWDIALRDLDRVLTLDADGDGIVTWGELRVRESDLRSYAVGQLDLLAGDSPCALTAQPLTLVEHSDGAYARLALHASCKPSASPLRVAYHLLFELDPQHRAVLRAGVGAHEQTFVLTAQRREQTLPRPSGSTAASMVALVRQGIEHILSGLDHVLFLLALLLPTVLRRRSAASSGEPVARVLGDVLRVVTAFTVAHSLTLGLAALGLVNMSASVIEPAIAASVAIAALDNLWPVFGSERWSIAFALGLLHGFGFSSALSDLGLQGASLLRGLLAFNVGVELGQLALVLLFVPCALLLGRLRSVPLNVMRGGSLAIACVALVWLCERVAEG
jgi:hypothetical protein